MKAYGANWLTDDPFEVELLSIQYGGRWNNKRGEPCGAGLDTHYRKLQSIIAPWKQWDRWSSLILEHIIKNRLTVLTGPASSTKTHNAAFYALCKYIVNPTRQCVLISSTDSRSLELRIWGEIKKLWSMARAVAPDLVPGRIIESRQMIVTDMDESEATDYRNGIIGVPCVVGGTFVGLGKFAGIKNGNVLLIADELSYMSLSFYDAISNLRKNPNFQCIGIGNPKDRTDVLGKLAEPASDIGGWEGYQPMGKTYVYRTRFTDGECIVLDGRDTPNNDTPPGQAPIYPYIITKEDIQRDIDYYGEDSIQVSMMDYGIFPKDAQSKRVITRVLCEKGRAFEDVIWSHKPLTKLFAIDAAYAAVGGDRCVGIHLAFGECTDGIIRLAFMDNPVVIPIAYKANENPEDQIANWVKAYCTLHGIPPSHVGFDSTGRGSLVSAFGRNWSTSVVAIEFGGKASDRPVSLKIQTPCRDYYLDFVSELWYQSRYLIEADQLRRLPVNVFEEGCMRAWDITKGHRIFVESKSDTKLRMGRSPDLYDSFVTGVEMARRLGFAIHGKAKTAPSEGNWVRDLLEKQQKLRAKYALKY